MASPPVPSLPLSDTADSVRLDLETMDLNASHTTAPTGGAMTVTQATAKERQGSAGAPETSVTFRLGRFVVEEDAIPSIDKFCGSDESSAVLFEKSTERDLNRQSRLADELGLDWIHVAKTNMTRLPFDSSGAAGRIEEPDLSKRKQMINSIVATWRKPKKAFGLDFWEDEARLLVSTNEHIDLYAWAQKLPLGGIVGDTARHLRDTRVPDEEGTTIVFACRCPSGEYAFRGTFKEGRSGGDSASSPWDYRMVKTLLYPPPTDQAPIDEEQAQHDFRDVVNAWTYTGSAGRSRIA